MTADSRHVSISSIFCVFRRSRVLRLFFCRCFRSSVGGQAVSFDSKFKQQLRIASDVGRNIRSIIASESLVHKRSEYQLATFTQNMGVLYYFGVPCMC